MCSACFFGKDRYRKPQFLIEEMKWLMDLGTKEIRFPFESGFNNHEMAKNLFNSMIREKINLKFTCNGRADRLNPELLKLMKEAGCKAINIGCETADETVMKNLKKMVTLEMVKNAVSDAKKAGLEVMTYFVFGLPGETKKSIKKTYDFAKNLGADIVTFGVAIPHPGTEFYNDLKGKKLLKSRNWKEYDPALIPPYNYPGLSGNEIYELSKKSYKSYYLNPLFILKRARKIGSMQELISNTKNLAGFLKRYL